jgi:hypothetical protein
MFKDYFGSPFWTVWTGKLALYSYPNDTALQPLLFAPNYLKFTFNSFTLPNISFIA